jgi:hypothetical protein
MRTSVATLSVITVALLSCGGRGASDAAAANDPNRPIALDEWCASVMNSACDRVGQCAGSTEMANGCKETGPAGCMGGRDPKMPSGRVASELGQCVQSVSALPCDNLVGELATRDECKVRAQP